MSGIKPTDVNMNQKELDDFIVKHPFISSIEIMEAFDLDNLKEADKFSKKLSLEEIKVPRGTFYQKVL